MRGLLAAAAVVLSLATPAVADDDDERVPPVTEPTTAKECGACHMAFQPAFLPARSWARMMDELADHFGDDASLPPDKAGVIRAYLLRNAGTARRFMRRLDADGAPQRITETPAFLREHRFRPETWARPDVVTRSNCPACHRGAEKGIYED